MKRVRASQPTSIDRRSIRRTPIVWASFIAAVTLATGLLSVADGSLRPVVGAPMLGPMSSTGEADEPRLLQRSIEFDRERWQGVVVHHSGSPAGDAESLNRLHTSYGLDGLGYHFVIGNGNGLGDGMIHVGERWLLQRAGAHAIGPDAGWHNQHSIAVCLIGNGERRPFTSRQIESLIMLVRGLQREFLIPSDRVMLHRDIADVKSPGVYFAEAAFRERLLRTPH